MLHKRGLLMSMGMGFWHWLTSALAIADHCPSMVGLCLFAQHLSGLLMGLWLCLLP